VYFKTLPAPVEFFSVFSVLQE